MYVVFPPAMDCEPDMCSVLYLVGRLTCLALSIEMLEPSKKNLLHDHDMLTHLLNNREINYYTSITESSSARKLALNTMNEYGAGPGASRFGRTSCFAIIAY